MCSLLDLVYVLLGAILSIIVTIVIEMTRKPSLVMEIENHDITNYEDGQKPANIAKFLYVNVKNENLPNYFKWLSRNAALQCHGSITFYYLNDGTKVFSDPMPIRWTSLPMPEVKKINVGDTIIQLIDMNKVNHDSRVDIYPGNSNSESLNIAAKFDSDEDCYGWTNENMALEPFWRTPKWKLPKGRYLVKVSILSASEKCEKLFRLNNDVSIKDFRLMPALATDRVID